MTTPIPDLLAASCRAFALQLESDGWLVKPFGVSDVLSDAADLIQQQLAEIERLSAEKAEWQRQLGHDLPAWSTRQARVDLRTPLDTVFAGAIAAIETWGAHPDLTSAQSLVSRAWSFINRWIEEGASGASDEARAALGQDVSDE